MVHVTAKKIKSKKIVLFVRKYFPVKREWRPTRGRATLKNSYSGFCVDDPPLLP
jgi:hypothetical protein